MQNLDEFAFPHRDLRHERGWVFKALGRAYLERAGWRLEGGFPEDPKAVIIVAPHTSNWDFVLGLAVVFALELRSSWLGKHTIFLPPFKGLLQWLGGIPVDRRTRNGVVGTCVDAFASVPARYLAIAPEGTRKGVSEWKTGFYLIATGAGVPIIPVTFDYSLHVVRIMPPFHPTGSLQDDLPRIRALFEGAAGLKPREKNHRTPSTR